MEANFRWGIVERLTVAAFVAGIAGVVASVTLPSYIQEYLSREWWGSYPFWISLSVVGASFLFFSCDLAIDIALRRSIKLGTVLVYLGTILIVIGGIVGLVGAFSLDRKSNSTTAPNQTKIDIPDVTLRFVYSNSPALLIVNQSDRVAANIKWTVVLWNLDDPRVYSGGSHASDAHEPLQIPISTFDFVRPRATGGPLNLFNSPLVSPYIKKGDRLIGSAGISCPECSRGHTFAISIIYGECGWYAEITDETSGNVFIPRKLNKNQVIEYAEMINKIPKENRIEITDP